MADRNRFGSLSLGLTQIRRQLSSQPAIVASLFIAVLVASVLLGSAPRLLEEVSSEDLAATVTDSHSANRNIAIERLGRLAPGPEDDPLLRVHAFGEQFEANEVPDSVRAVISDSYSLFESPQFTVSALPGEDPPHPFTMFLRFSYQDRIEDEMKLIDGRFPAPQEPVPWLVGSACPTEPDVWLEMFDLLSKSEEPLIDEDGNEIACAIDEISHYEVVVSPLTMEALGLGLGQQMMLTPDATDSLYFGLDLDELRYNLVVSVSGIAEFSDPELDYWYGDTDLHRPRIQENADLRIIFATGVIDPNVYRDIFRDVGFASLRYTYREFVSPVLIQDADLDGLVSDLREFQTTYTAVVAAPNRPRVITQLPDLLEDHLIQRSETVAIMSTTVANLFIVAAAVVLLLAVLMTSRQRPSLVYSRNRGASRIQMGLTRIYEGLILVAPGVVLGYLIAGLVFDGTEDLTPYRITVALVVAAIVMVVTASWHPITASLGELQREAIHGRQSSTRRIVAEALVTTLALGSIVLLRRRGSVEDRVSATSFDWLLALTPALLSVAVAAVTLWVFPYVIRTISWGAAQLRGLVGYIGFRRLLNRSSGGAMSLAVLLICVSAAVFASIARISVDDGQEASSYQAVGADYTIEAVAAFANIPASVDVSSLPEIEESAFATRFDRARLKRDTLDLPTEVIALDTASYDAVTKGTAGEANLPSSISGIPLPGEGSEDLPMPAIVADDWPGGFEPRIGDTYTIDLGRLQPVVEVVELRPRFPGLPNGRPFVVINRATLEALSGLPVAPTVQYIRGSESGGGAIVGTVRDQTAGAVVTSRYELLGEFSADPFIHWVERGFTTVFVFSAVLAIVAAVSALALASSQRRIDFAYLKTLGLNNRQATVLTILEQVPVVATATAVGVLAGVGVSLALDPALNYDAFTGNLVPTVVAVDWQVIGLLAIGVFVALSAAIVIFVLATRRQDIGQILRVGDE